MASYLNISELAQAVLDSVESDTTSKTASVDAPSLKTEIGLALKQAAEMIRSFSPEELSNDDLQILFKTAAVSSRKERSSNNPSALGNELRKIASALRESGDKQADNKAIKVAHMVTAAVGLKYLTEGVK